MRSEGYGVDYLSNHSCIYMSQYVLLLVAHITITQDNWYYSPRGLNHLYILWTSANSFLVIENVMLSFISSHTACVRHLSFLVFLAVVVTTRDSIANFNTIYSTHVLFFLLIPSLVACKAEQPNLCLLIRLALDGPLTPTRDYQEGEGDIVSGHSISHQYINVDTLLHNYCMVL